MPHYLILNSENDEMIKGLIRSITNLIIDLGNTADQFFFNEAPSGVNLNRYDGIVIGAYSEKTLNCREVTAWIEKNIELLSRKQWALFLLKSEGQLCFSQTPTMYSVVSTVQDATLFTLSFESEVHRELRCGLSYESQFKREYLENGRKLAFH